VPTARRAFLWAAGLLLVAPLPAAVGSMVDRFLATHDRPRRIVIPPDQQGMVTFADGVIVTRAGGEVRAFSARCTHLGCLIDRSAHDLLVCPCHGSRFRLDGTVANGPALRPLAPLAHEIDPVTGSLVVHAT
jgi:Rieske Fe-S protein